MLEQDVVIASRCLRHSLAHHRMSFVIMLPSHLIGLTLSSEIVTLLSRVTSLVSLFYLTQGLIPITRSGPNRYTLFHLTRLQFFYLLWTAALIHARVGPYLRNLKRLRVHRLDILRLHKVQIISIAHQIESFHLFLSAH